MTFDWRKHVVGDLSWKRAFKGLAFVYVVVGTWGYFAADGLILLPQPSSYRDGKVGTGAPYVWPIAKVATADKAVISAAHFPNPKAAYTVLYSHGNAEDLGENVPVMRALQAAGFAVFTYDYPGYGTSGGGASEAGCTAAIEAAYRHLTGPLGVHPEQVIAYGRSVGGGPTMALAANSPVAGVILESTFTSAIDVRLPFNPYPFDKFPSRTRLKSYQGPVLVMHGRADDLIPVTHGEALYAAAPGPKQQLFVDGAGHDDFKEVAGPRWLGAVRAFAATLAAKPGT